MGEQTQIQWCDHTFNPWIGCTKVSPGCANCYAEVSTRARVLRHRGQETWGKGAQRSRTSESNWKEPLRWNKAAGQSYDSWKFALQTAASEFDGVEQYARPRVFCASLSDWLDDEVPIEWLADLLKLIHDTPH